MDEERLIVELRRMIAALENIDRKLTIISREMDTSGPNGSALTMALGEIRDAVRNGVDRR